jgi:hypothetical protein
MKPTAKIAPTAGRYTCGGSKPFGIAVFACVVLAFFGSIDDFKKPIIVDVGNRIGSFHETESESFAYLHTGEMLPQGETVQFGGRVYKVVDRFRDWEWGNMYSLERVDGSVR